MSIQLLLQVKYQPKYEEDADSKLQKLINNLETGPGYVSDGESKKRGNKKSKSLAPPKPRLPGQLFDEDSDGDEKEVRNILTPRREHLNQPQLELERLSLYSQEGSKSRLCNTCSSLLEIAKSDAGSMRSFADLNGNQQLPLGENGEHEDALELPDEIATVMNADEIPDALTSDENTGSQKESGSAGSQRLFKSKQKPTFAGLSLASLAKKTMYMDDSADGNDVELENLENENLDNDIQAVIADTKPKPAASKKKRQQKIFKLKIPKAIYGILPVNKLNIRVRSKERRSDQIEREQREAEATAHQEKETIKTVDDDKDVDTSLEPKNKPENATRGRSQIRSTYQHRSRVVQAKPSLKKPLKKPTGKFQQVEGISEPVISEDKDQYTTDKTREYHKPLSQNPVKQDTHSQIPGKQDTHSQYPAKQDNKPALAAAQDKPKSDNTPPPEKSTPAPSQDQGKRKASGISLVSRAGSCDSRSKEISPAKVEENQTKPKKDAINVKPADTEIKRRNIDMNKIHRDIQQTPYATMPEMDNIYSPQVR